MSERGGGHATRGAGSRLWVRWLWRVLLPPCMEATMYLTRHWMNGNSRWAADGVLLAPSFTRGCCLRCSARGMPRLWA